MFSEIFSAATGCYFIGIGGVSMSALALLLHGRGIAVRGSDAQESGLARKLRAAGIPVSIGEGEEITEDIVVYTGAIAENHPQLSVAVKAGKRLIPRAELLGMLAATYPHVLSVAGCHGKTTTSCMLAHILKESGRPFACHIGGEDLSLGNCYSTGGEYFVTEACEFQRSFLSIRSEIAVILNCDRDHTDCYATKAELLAAYRAFTMQAQKVVVNADDPAARSIAHTVSFGLHAGDIRAEHLRSDGERYSFTVVEKGIPVIRVRLRICGKVHVFNALAAFAAARLIGLTAGEIKAGLESFRGVKRRFEQIGTLDGASVVCDYAHHPREIAAVLSTAQRLCDGKVHVVFQPHTYTRTRDLMDDFVDVLKRADRPLIYKTYAAREKFDWAGSAALLASKFPSASYIPSPEQLKAQLRERGLEKDDLILVLGAGDIYDIAASITE